MPDLHLLFLVLLLVSALLVADHLWRARQVRVARRKRLEARIAELKRPIRYTRIPRSGQAARAGADGPTPARPHPRSS